MTASAIAWRYASALADLVTAEESPVEPKEATRLLRDFEAVLNASAELREVLASPAVPATRKRAVVDRLAGRLSLPRVLKNFLFVLIDHGRMPVFSEIADACEAEVDERLGFARAEVSAASELDPAQRAVVTGQLERLTGKKMRVEFSVDEQLIGGVVARIGSVVYDGSLKGRLEQLRRELTAE